MLPRRGVGAEELLEVDREGIGLLAAGAAGAPDCQGLVLLMPLGQFRQNAALQEGEMLFFPHKIGIVGGQLVDHQLQIRRVPLGHEPLQKFREVMKALDLERVGEAADDELTFFAQVDAVVLLDKLDHPIEILIGNGDVLK